MDPFLAAAEREQLRATAAAREHKATAQGKKRPAATKEKCVARAAATTEKGSAARSAKGAAATREKGRELNCMIPATDLHGPAAGTVGKDKYPHPHGGFVNMLNNQNFHYGDSNSQYDTFKGAGSAGTGDFSQQFEDISTPRSFTEKQCEQETINVESGDEVVRTDKQILWTPEEDLRLMSAWLKNSMDPISGNDKKNDQYWGDVATTYNSTTPTDKKRNQKQAKDRWHKVNKWTDLFHSAWLKARRLYTSGHNDQMWIDKAHKL